MIQQQRPNTVMYPTLTILFQPADEAKVDTFMLYLNNKEQLVTDGIIDRLDKVTICKQNDTNTMNMKLIIEIRANPGLIYSKSQQQIEWIGIASFSKMIEKAVSIFGNSNSPDARIELPSQNTNANSSGANPSAVTTSSTTSSSTTSSSTTSSSTTSTSAACAPGINTAPPISNTPLFFQPQATFVYNKTVRREIGEAISNLQKEFTEKNSFDATTLKDQNNMLLFVENQVSSNIPLDTIIFAINDIQKVTNKDYSKIIDMLTILQGTLFPASNSNPTTNPNYSCCIQ